MRCFSFAVIVFFILALGGLGSDFGFGISRILGGIFLPYQLEEAVELFLDDLAGHFGAEYLGHALVGLVVQISGAAGDLFVTYRILTMPKDVLVLDTGMEMKFFAPTHFT